MIMIWIIEINSVSIFIIALLCERWKFIVGNGMMNNFVSTFGVRRRVYYKYILLLACAAVYALCWGIPLFQEEI